MGLLEDLIKGRNPRTQEARCHFDSAVGGNAHYSWCPNSAVATVIMVPDRGFGTRDPLRICQTHLNYYHRCEYIKEYAMDWAPVVHTNHDNGDECPGVTDVIERSVTRALAKLTPKERKLLGLI